jgi:ketosteroid isomerase-like protein
VNLNLDEESDRMASTRVHWGTTFAGAFVMAACATGHSSTASLAESLQAASAQWERALAERDADRAARFFADDVVAMYPHVLPTIGQQANHAAWTRVFASPGRTHPIRIEEVITSQSGDLGYTFGYWWNIDPESGTDSGGRFLAVWRPVHGEWKIARLSANNHEDVRSDSAPAGQP